MHMRIRGRHIMVPETSQITNFQAHFFYITRFILVNKPNYRYNIFLWASFL